MNKTSGYWDSLNMEVQVEEVYNDLLLSEQVVEGSEDIMDRPVFSLEALKEGARAGSYMMEDMIEAAVEFDDLWDESGAMDRVYTHVQLRRVGGDY